MYKVSPFTPLFFNPSNDKFGIESRYIQKFSSFDQILIEVIAVSEFNPIIGNIIDVMTGKKNVVEWKVWVMNSTMTLYYYILSGLNTGYYRFEINGFASDMFEVTDDERELSKTTLIQYSMKDNKQRKDGFFFIAEKQYFFDWRAPGGFQDMNWGFSVSNEQFVTTDEDVVDLYSSESTQKAFTLGNAEGCPVWYAEMLNRIMSCTYVYFDGERYVRKDSSVPEMNQVNEGLNSYVFSLSVQPVLNIDKGESDNQLIIRRVDRDRYRSVNNKLLIL